MKRHRPKVSIILLNYNGFDDSISCFQSLQQISYVNYDVIIVDNASPDASMDKFVAYMQEQEIEHVFFKSPEVALQDGSIAKVSLIHSDFNGGYGYGNNIGIKYALKNGADYVLILNNDTIVNPDFLEPMVQMCEEDTNIGIASGKIYFYDRPDTFWFNGGKLHQCTAKAEHFNFNEKDVGQIINEPVTFISGCMWLIPVEVFKRIGFINEEYFMYVEDVEYCQRIVKQGYKLKVCGDSVIYHNVGGTSGGHLSDFSVYWMARNYYSFIKENVNGLCKIIAFGYLIIFKPIRWLLKRRFSLFKNHVVGLFDAVLGK